MYSKNKFGRYKAELLEPFFCVLARQKYDKEVTTTNNEDPIINNLVFAIEYSAAYQRFFKQLVSRLSQTKLLCHAVDAVALAKRWRKLKICYKGKMTQVTKNFTLDSNRLYFAVTYLR